MKIIPPLPKWPCPACGKLIAWRTKTKPLPHACIAPIEIKELHELNTRPYNE